MMLLKIQTHTFSIISHYSS